MKNVLPLSESEFGLFQKLLVEESGLYFDKDRSQSLQLALWERLQKRGYDSCREYYNFLKFNPEGQSEIRKLLDLITIGETYFFRNSPHFEALTRFVLPEIIQKKMCLADKSIRVWSAGCSKGDEPYSIAIAIIEALPSYKSWDISLLGTDINRDALIQSKEAIYGKKDVAHLSEKYLDRYFQKRGTNYILNDEVKKLVRFEYHNLAKDSFAQDMMQNLDIIFCRNVTIYFDFQTTKRAIDNFYKCLTRDGYLFIGHAETLWQITNKLETVRFPQTFIYKKAHLVEEEVMRPFIGVPEIKLEEFPPIGEAVLGERIFSKETGQGEKAEPIGEIEKPLEAKEESDSLYKEATRLFDEKNYQEALSLFDKIIFQDKNYIRAHFAKATILANQARYKEAISELSKIIEGDNLYVEAYYLLGVLSYKIGDFKEAEVQFRKVIYVEPNLVLAYFNLGNVYLYQRKFSKAAREFNNAVRLLEARPREEQVRFCEDFTVEFLLRACKNNLTEINPVRNGDI